MPPDRFSRDDATNAVAVLMAQLAVPAGDVAAVVALARRRTALRRASAIGVIVVALATAVSLVTANGAPPKRSASAAPVTTNFTPATPPTTVPSVRGGIIGCPQRPVTTAPAGDPPAGLVAAAIRDVSAHSLFTGATISSVYRLGLLDAGAFSSAFAENVTSCGPVVVTDSWVVELHHPAAAQLSAVVLAHYANGWHVFGSYP